MKKKKSLLYGWFVVNSFGGIVQLSSATSGVGCKPNIRYLQFYFFIITRKPGTLRAARSVQGPDPDTNPDRVGQYNPEHRGRGCNWPGLEFRRG